jgi:hypothetical protein
MANLAIPVERINTEARQLDPATVALTVLLFVPFVLGWTTRKVWMVLAWLWTAVVVGWQEAGRPRQAEAGADDRS